MNTQLSYQLELLNQNDKMLNDLYHNYAINLNLSDTALWILYIAWIHQDGCTQKDICEMWYYTKQTINTALKNLEKQGYIKLVPMLENRKSKKILFTDSGKIFAKKVITPLLEAETISFSKLSEKERNDLVYLSQKRTMLFEKEIEKTISKISKE